MSRECGGALGGPPFPTGAQGSRGTAACAGSSWLVCASCRTLLQVLTCFQSRYLPVLGARAECGPGYLLAGSLLAGWFAFMNTHMSLQIGPQRHQNESLAIAGEMPLHLRRPGKVADCTHHPLLQTGNGIPRALLGSGFPFIYGVSLLAVVWGWPALRDQL